MGAEGSSLAGAEAALVDGEHHRGRGKVAQRREHAAEFVACIRGLNEAPPPPLPQQQQQGTAAPKDGTVRVALRKRPLFPHEAAKGDFDVVNCVPASGGSGPTAAGSSVWCVHESRYSRSIEHDLLN